MSDLAARGPLKPYIINQTSHWFIVGLIFPILILLVLDKGLTVFEAGMTFAVYSGTAVLLELPTGGMADSLGRRRVYILSLVVHMAAMLTFLWAFDLLTVLMATFLMGSGRALSSGSIDAWFVDEFKAHSPQGDLQQALARANVFIPIGLGLGSLTGGVLPMTLGVGLRGELGWSIYAANIIIVVIADLVQILVTRIIIKEEHRPRGQVGWKDGLAQVPSVISTSITLGIRNRTLLILLLVMMAFGFGLTGLELLWQPRVTQIMGDGAQTWVLGVLAAAYFLITSAGSVLVTPLRRMLGGDNGVLMGVLLVAMGGTMIVLAMQEGILLFAVLYLLTYLVIGMTNSPYAALYNDEIPAEHRSTMLSFQSLVLQGGGLIGSMVLGYVAGERGISVAWTIAAVVIATSSIGFIYLRVKSKDVLNGKRSTEIVP